MKNKLYKIAPSILAADPMNIGRDAILAEKSGAYRLSVDVMDGHFVSDITFGSNIIFELKKLVNIPVEVHLMIRGKRAKILVKMNRDPSDILFVSDDVGNDITMEVVPYRNYKYIDFTPEILGCKQIEIIDISGSTQRFCGDTSIN